MYKKINSKLMLFSIIIGMLLITTTSTTIGMNFSDPVITIRTDKPAYLPGETVVVTGRLTNDGEGVENSPYCVGIYDPLEMLIGGICGPTGTDGYYSFSSSLPLYSDLGTYNATVHSDEFDISAHVYFDVISEDIEAETGGPYNGTVGEPIYFTGNASGGLPPYSWLWNLGDGETSNEQNPVHTYDSAGQYFILLNVTDDNMNYGLDKTIVVISEEPDTTPPTLEIITPESALYLMNKKVFSFPAPFIIGSIDLEVTASDGESGVASVEFVIDGEIMATLVEEPYLYTWDERGFSSYMIQINVFDNAGNSVESEVLAYKFF